MNTTDHQAAFHIRTCDTGHYGSTKAICRKIVKQGKIIFAPILCFNIEYNYKFMSKIFNTFIKYILMIFLSF